MKKLGTRGWAAIGAAAALAVTLVFAFIGDGVDSKGTGAVKWITEYGHTITWALLTVSLALVAWGRAPTWAVSAAGFAALGSYAAFLIALFVA